MIIDSIIGELERKPYIAEDIMKSMMRLYSGLGKEAYGLDDKTDLIEKIAANLQAQLGPLMEEVGALKTAPKHTPVILPKDAGAPLPDYPVRYPLPASDTNHHQPGASARAEPPVDGTLSHVHLGSTQGGGIKPVPAHIPQIGQQTRRFGFDPFRLLGLRK